MTGTVGGTVLPLAGPALDDAPKGQPEVIGPVPLVGFGLPVMVSAM